MPNEDLNRLYEIAFNEVKLNRVDKALWARAYAENNGDQEKAKAWYISERVKHFQTKMQQTRHKKKEIPTQNAASSDPFGILHFVSAFLGVIIIFLIASLFLSNYHSHDAAKKAIEKMLTDPSSVQYRELKSCREGLISGEYNAKNSMGGYVGFRKFFFDGETIYDSDFDAEAMEKKFCTGRSLF